MKTIRALLWLDWRLVRWDWLSMLLLCTVMPVIARYAAHEELAYGILSFFGLPVAGALLGATVASADPARGFVQSRPVQWSTIIALRLSQRCVLALALIGLTRGVLGLVSESGGGLGPAVAVWLTLTALGSTAIASAFVRHPIAALPVGLIGFLVATAPLSFVMVGPGLMLAMHPISALVAVAGAWFVATVRGGSAQMQWGRFLLRVGVATTVLGIVGLIAAELVVRAEMRQADEAWSWFEEPASTLPDLDALGLAMERLTAAGLVGGAPKEGRSWLPRRQQAPWFRETTRRLDEEMRASRRGNIALVPTVGLERGLGNSRAAVDHLVSSLSQEDALGAITAALGNGSLRDLLTVLIADAIVLHARGEARAATGELALVGRLLAARARSGWWGALDRSRFLYTEYQLANSQRGVAYDLDTARELAELELRESIFAEQRRAWHGYRQGFAANPLTLGWRYRLARAHATSGRVFEELTETGACERPEALKEIESDPVMGSRNLWMPAVNTELWADLDYLVSARRAGLDVELESACADTEWITESQDDGGWTIRLEGGAEMFRHDEPAPRDIQRERR